MTDLSVCVPVYRVHEAPNVAGLAADLPAAAGRLRAELVVTCNGVRADRLGLPDTARTVAFEVNRGVAPGWNAAAAASTGEYLVFANDDVRLGPESLEMLVDALAAHPEAGVVGPVGSRFDFADAAHIDWVATDGHAPGELVACDVVSGFLFCVRRRDFDAVGGFDEAYVPATMEEIDLELAIRLDLGLGTFVVAGAAVEHRFNVSAAPAWRRVSHNGRREFLFRVHRRNRRHFFAKWAGRL